MAGTDSDLGCAACPSIEVIPSTKKGAPRGAITARCKTITVRCRWPSPLAPNTKLRSVLYNSQMHEMAVVRLDIEGNHIQEASFQFGREGGIGTSWTEDQWSVRIFCEQNGEEPVGITTFTTRSEPLFKFWGRYLFVGVGVGIAAVVGGLLVARKGDADIVGYLLWVGAAAAYFEEVLSEEDLSLFVKVVVTVPVLLGADIARNLVR